MDNLAKQNAKPMLSEPEPPSEKAGAAPAPAYKKSKGDILFDVGVYGGIGYIANAAISLVVDRYATHLPTAKLYKYGQATKRWFARGFERVMSNEQAVEKWSELSTSIAVLGFGGWALLFPMKWLEDRKVGIIRGLDSKLGTGPQTPEGVQAQIEAIDTGPRQSAASLVLGRVVSYSATIAAALPFVSDWTPVGKNFSLYLNDKLGGHLKESWKTPTVKIDGVAIPKVINSLAYEIILAGTASVLHYGSSKLFAYAGHNPANTHGSIGAPSTRVSHVSDDVSPMLSPEKSAEKSGFTHP